MKDKELKDIVKKINQALPKIIKHIFDNPERSCTYFSPDWWHEVGCQHRKWSRKEIINSIAKRQ